uniref:STAS domain-containing protein n=1 Tax=Ascaris lumbricoides TaxID=6252 RepID=A0A9J2PEZ2_ASCLU
MGSQHGTGRGQQTAQFIHARVEFGRKLLRQSGEKSGKRVVIFDEEFGLFTKSHRLTTKQAIAARITENCRIRPSNICDTILDFIPILKWLPKYNIRQNLIHDIVGGLTVGIMNVPQGMAYASLAGLSPINGLYTSFFPAIVYMFFGTSRHNSLGVFAVVSLMVGSTNIRLSKQLNGDSEADDSSNLTSLLDVISSDFPQTKPIDIVMALTLCLAMAVLRLDFLTAYMSDQVIKGFTTGAAVHVFVAQLNKIFGVTLPRHSGFGKLFRVLRDLIVQLPTANIATTVISAATIVILYVCKNHIAPRLTRFTKIPVPFDLFAIIIGTALSYIIQMETTFHVKVVGEIPLGLPAPSLPRLRLLPYVFGDAFAIAIIVLAVTVSMGSLFAKKHGYTIDIRQEFYAMGITECVTSLFPCFTSSTALTRSVIYEAAGTKTQLATIFSSLLMLLVIFVLGAFIKVLPVCLLSCIVLVALKGMLVQLSDLPRLWSLSKIDFTIWLFTFIATVVCDVIQGLAVGIIFALFMIIFRTQRSEVTKLGRMSHSAGSVYYRPLQRYRDACYVENVCCVHFEGPLLFVNAERFKKSCFEVLKPSSLHSLSKKAQSSESVATGIKVGPYCHVNLEPHHVKTHKRNASNVSIRSIRLDATVDDDQKKILTLGSFKGLSEIKYVVVDLSSVSYIDVMGSSALKDVYQGMKQRDIRLYYSSTQLSVLEFVKRCEFGDDLPLEEAFYPSMEDAIHAIDLFRGSASENSQPEAPSLGK